MALIHRFARLLRADLHAMLDRIEEPEVLLRQALRDMEEALAGDERRGTSLEAEAGQLAARERDARAAVATATAELEQCFAAGREDLARGVLRRRLEQEAFAERLMRRAAELGRERGELARRIEDRHMRLEAMRQKAGLLACQHDDEPGTRGIQWRCTISEEDVELALLRERERRATP